ncbi:MAG: DUF4303 domain-containing protein [Planctomycetota bacterium]
MCETRLGGPSYKDLVTALVTATRDAFSELRRAHSDYRFYYYCLWSSCMGDAPTPCACSLEGLDEVVNQYSSQGGGESKSELRESLRWSEADSPHFGFADEKFALVRDLFDKLPSSHEVGDGFCEVRRRIAAMERALVLLDRDGFFGTGRNRENVIINVFDDEEEMLPRAERLNPANALLEYGY